MYSSLDIKVYIYIITCSCILLHSLPINLYNYFLIFIKIVMFSAWFMITFIEARLSYKNLQA